MQCSCDVEMKIDLILIDPPYNVCQELGRWASDYDLFGKNDAGEMVDVCGDHFELGGLAHIFCSSTQLLSWAKAVSASTESATFWDSEGNEQVQNEALFDQEKQGLLCVRDWRNL